MTWSLTASTCSELDDDARTVQDELSEKDVHRELQVVENDLFALHTPRVIAPPPFLSASQTQELGEKRRSERSEKERSWSGFFGSIGGLFKG
jgi:hypothetical protein